MIPDITTQTEAQYPVPLDWVGMKKVQLPIIIADQTLPATADILVNLTNQKAKGVHMSRLYLEAEKTLSGQNFTPKALIDLTKRCLKTQGENSDEAFLKIHTTIPRPHQSLLSDNTGWRHYPITFSCRATADSHQLKINFELTYSSTCPCSAALARQSLQTKFKTAFPGKNIDQAAALEWLVQAENQAATPHSQRSVAQIELEVTNLSDMSEVIELITAGEQGLQTVVQGAVKRVDEQRFAELNAQNLMFSEDAARRLQNVYEPMKPITGYHIEVQHLESLHPHDAVAIVTKREA